MYKIFKNVRVGVSLLFLVLITTSFLHFANSKTPFFSNLLKLQFVPSLLGIFTGTAVVFVLLLLLTLFFGRVYCSSICPLGVFQDVTTRASNLFKTKKQKRFTYDKPKKSRYIILAIIALFLIGGITLPLAYLDPYSIWGRISNSIINSSEQLINNGISFLFPNSVYFRTFGNFAVGSFLFAFFLLITIILFSAFRGRLYCNTICPVGSFLGLISKFAAFQPVINKESCTRCHRCVIKCKSQCIDLKTQTVDTSRCVACMNCVAACRNNSMSLSFTWKKTKKLLEQDKSANSKEKKAYSPDRRRALIAMGLMGTAFAVRAVKLGPIMNARPKITGISPPGSVSIAHLKQNCTACHACISACPSNIIKPATMEYGINGVLLPVLSFDHNYCGYDCNECSKVCPSNAIMPITLEDKKLARVGKVRFTPKRCIVFTDKTACGACEEHCPTKAITMVPYKNMEGLYFPSVHLDFCIGCGGCEFSCPALPEKAMIVDGLDVHERAMKPLKERQEEVVVDDFGF